MTYSKLFYRRALIWSLEKGFGLHGKIVSVILLSLLVVSALSLAFNVQRVKASGTIHINADGSIDPPTAPVYSADNITYTLTGNITSDTGGIAIARDNIVLNGAGHTVAGSGSGNGITLTSRSNVTAGNMMITDFANGILLNSSSSNTLSGNNVANSWYGIITYSSSSNAVCGNNITNNGAYGVTLGDTSENNAVYGNNITGQGFAGVFLAAPNNIVCGNNITNNGIGIQLNDACNNTIYGNNIANNTSYYGGYGVYFGVTVSSGAHFYHNNFVGNGVQVGGGASVNVWDDGYPSGGNYWSDYTGLDLDQGPYQNVTGSDGIGDTPYAIDANNTDNYPLMQPWTGAFLVPALLSIFFSENPVSVGLPTVCTAMVVGSDPTGTISWSTSSLTGSFSQSACTLSSGEASTTYVDTNPGNVTISATYSGDVNNAPSRSSATLEEIAQEGGNQKTLRIGFTDPLPGTLNPLIDQWTAAGLGASQVMANIFSPLVRFNETGLVVPDLAENWEVSQDCCHFTFHLFNNVTWHDGFKFNASDVKFTFDQVVSNPEVVSGWKVFLDDCNFSSVEILDEYTIMFNLESPNVSFLNIVGEIPIIPWHIYDETDLATNPQNNNPVGTGPFKFVEWNPGINMTLAANGAYFRGRPYLDEIFFRRDITGTALPEALLNNTVDMVPFYTDPTEIEHLHQFPGVSVLDLKQPNFQFIYLNFSNPILSDVNVREALTCAINQSEICKTTYAGYATPATGPVPPVYSYWYNSNLSEFVYNKTLAEQLLDETGYPRNNETGIRFNLNFRIMGQTANSHWSLEAYQKIRNYWQDIGVNTTSQVGLPIGGPSYDCLFVGWIYDYNDPDDLRYLFYTNATWNLGGYSNATVDYLFDQGISTSSQTLREQIYNELQTVLSGDLPCIFLWYDNSETAYNNDFHGIVPYGLGAMSPFVLERVWYDSTLSGAGKCPMLVSFVDSGGRRTGFDPKTGQAVVEIPESTYSGLDSDPQLVKIPSPSGNYTIELYGTGNGNYSLEIVNIALSYKHVNVPTGWIQPGDVIRFYVQVDTKGGIGIIDARPDINGDGVVNILDAIILANAFLSTPTSPNWNAKADINGDGVVNILDAIILANNFLQHFP
jgi:peptide/nickel transport system substrate-binding protein